MRRALFAASAILAACAIVAAAEELSEQSKQKIARIREEVRSRVEQAPLTFEELCRIEVSRIDRNAEDGFEVDPLLTLSSLKRSLRGKIRELNPFWEPETKRKPKKKIPILHKEYDILDIVSVAPDKPAPNIGFGRGQSLYWGASNPSSGIIDLGGGEDSSHTGPGFDWEAVQNYIYRIIAQERTGGIGYRKGKLICDVTAEEAGQIEELLALLRRASGYTVTLEVKFIRTSGEYAAELAKSNDGSLIYLSPEAENKLLSDTATGNGVTVVASSEVVAANSQVVHVREGRQVSLLMDYDINTVGIPTLQPVVKLVNEGLICQFRPMVIRGGREVAIDVSASLSAIQKRIRKGNFLGGELMFPAMDMARLRTLVRVPDRRSVLVGGTALTPEADKNGHEFMIYLKPTINHEER